MRHPKYIYYKGSKYRLQDSGRYYTDLTSHRRLLHRIIWKEFNGDIPEGYCVHHKNFKWWDNRISNLELQTKSAHSSLHMTANWKNPIIKRKMLAGLPERLAIAYKWHKTEDGIAWHKQNSKNIWKNAKPRNFVCMRCGAKFSRVCFSKTSRFCSEPCKSAFKYKSQPKLKKKCIICGSMFSTGIYKPAKNCSRRCTTISSNRIKLTNKINKGNLQAKSGLLKH